MRVLVLGATGMLGHTVFEHFFAAGDHEVWGTVRNDQAARAFSPAEQARLRRGVDVLDEAALTATLDDLAPDVVINCIGVIKQLAAAHDPLVVLPINAMLPHRLARWCAAHQARLIHISTDCVFAGTRGGYTEADRPDTIELYGLSKFIGEVTDQPGALTLRVSIVGHELASHHSLIDWFLSQEGSARGYTRAIFSGLPTIELARLLRTVVLPRPDLHGLYHVSAAAISKCELLQIVARVYGKSIAIVPDDSVIIDRSLNSQRFSEATGYVAPSWPHLVEAMHASRRSA
jgi:dTDP-4-dehydrorhamnose reductase